MRARGPLVVAVLAAFAGAGCDHAPAGALTRCDASRAVPGAVQTDILFVVDDSGSMADEQTNLHDNLDAFIQALSAAPIANDFQIGVTTTSVENYGGVTKYASGTPYPAGALVAIGRDAAGNPVPGDILWTAAGGFGGTRILTAGSPTLVRDFSANVLVGTVGSGKEQPFRAARLALSDRIADGRNAGFLRAGARLAVVFLSDEDDCSNTTAPFAMTDDDCHSMTWKNGALDKVDDYVAFLNGPIAGQTRNTLVATIVGVDPVTLAPSCGELQCTDKACSTAQDKGDRFVQLVGALGAVRTRLASICDPSFRRALEDIAGLLVSQTMPLDGAPADWRMLAVGVERGTATLPCRVALYGTADVATADAVYTPPQAGGQATLTFQNACRLQQGDTVRLDVVCAG